MAIITDNDIRAARALLAESRKKESQIDPRYPRAVQQEERAKIRQKFVAEFDRRWGTGLRELETAQTALQKNLPQHDDSAGARWLRTYRRSGKAGRYSMEYLRELPLAEFAALIEDAKSGDVQDLLTLDDARLVLARRVELGEGAAEAPAAVLREHLKRAVRQAPDIVRATATYERDGGWVAALQSARKAITTGGDDEAARTEFCAEVYALREAGTLSHDDARRLVDRELSEPLNKNFIITRAPSVTAETPRFQTTDQPPQPFAPFDVVEGKEPA